MVAVAVLGGAVKFWVRFQIIDLKVTELFVHIVNCVVAGTVHAAITGWPVFIDYNTE